VNKRINAALIVALFALGIVAVPVSAHFTLGRLRASPPFRTNDFDRHVFGVVAYVWPGAGLYGTVVPGFGDYPGYQSPYPRQHPPNLPSGFYQLESSNYAPFGAILTSTVKAGTPFNKMKVSGNPTIETKGTWVDGADVQIEHANKGDLVIALNATGDYTKGYYDSKGLPVDGFNKVQIMIPPEFTGIRRNIVASWTNNYDLYTVGTNSMESSIAPGWTSISIYADPDFPIVFTDRGEWYYIRINDVTAPAIAGRFFFKIFMGDAPDWPALDECPPQNWPVLLVKGEVDPCIIEGTIRYGGWNTALYGQPVALPGRVRVVGTADDPYTGQPTGRPVEARGYFNHTANGHYEVEGVAQGTYDIYASLAGYPEVKIASNMKVLKGQSKHYDGYVSPGAIIHGEVFSKCGLGEINWKTGTLEDPFGQAPTTQNIKIEIYKSQADAEATLPASSSTKAISWSPAGKTRQFAWPGYAGGIEGKDPDGVGPSQTWSVDASKTNFQFKFGDKGLYGAPAQWMGHIPQTYATWTDGIGHGAFWIRAWTHGYLQTLADGVTLNHVAFAVPSIRWPGDVFVPFDLFLGSWIVKELHLHDIPGTLQDNGFNLPDSPAYRYLYVDVKDKAGTRWGWAVRGVPFHSEMQEPTNEFRAGGPREGYNFVGVRGLLGRAEYQRSYGIPAGTYVVRGYAAGYVDQRPTTITIGMCGCQVMFSDHLHRGAIFDITVYSVDWQHPNVPKKWVWDKIVSGKDLRGESIYIMPCDASGNPLAGIDYETDSITSLPDETGALTVPLYWGMPILEQNHAKDHATVRSYYGAEGHKYETGEPGFYPLAFESGTYSFKAFTYGYVQKKAFSVYARKGDKVNIPIKVHVGTNVTFSIIFKRQSMIDHLRYDSAVRVRLFNDKNVLVGEALTSDYTKFYANAPNSDLENQAQLKPLSNAAVLGAPDFINYIPSSARRLQGLIAGLPDLAYGAFAPTCQYRGLTYNFIGGQCNYSPDPYFDMLWTGMPIPAPYGIDAAPNYIHSWHIEVDVVPRYRNHDEFVNGVLTHRTDYYPPPPGVLTGESPKYVPENHLGPYEQRYRVTVPGAHLGGEASVIFGLDLRGLLTGNVYGYTHCGDWRTTSWVAVLAVGADGKKYPWYTFDGRYEMWLSPGTYSLQAVEWSLANQGHKIETVPSYIVSEGSEMQRNFYLEQSAIPIPEFGMATLVLASALASSLLLVRRRKR